MEGNKQRETHRQRPDDRGDVQAPAFLLPTVLASLGLDDADVQSPLTTDILLHALHDEDYKVRVWAVRVLGRQVGSVAMEPLMAALRDEQWQVRATAVFVLADLGASAPVEALAAALHDEDRAVRTAAVRALSLLKEHELVAEALSDSDWQVREAAALALGEFGSSAPALPLVSAFKDDNSTVREAAMWALQQAHPAIAEAMASEASAPIKQQLARAPQARVDEMQAQATDSEDVQEESGVIVTDLPARTPRYAPPTPRRRLWHIVEGAIAAVLVAGILLSWLVVAQHFHPSVPARQSQPAPTPVQSALPLTHPAKILFNYHGKGNIFMYGWTPDSRYLAFINDNPSTPGEFVNGGENVYVWDATTRKLTRTFTLPTLPAGVQGNFGFGPGRYLIFFADNGLLQVWDFVSAQKLLTYQQANGGWIYWGWSNDSKLIALNSQSDGKIEIWNVTTGRKVAAYTVPVQNIFEMLWSPDDRYIAAASNDRVMMVWDAMTGKIVLNVPHYDVEYVEWAPDAQRLFAALPIESEVQVWNVFSGKLLQTSSNYSHNTARWASDGVHIISFEDNQWLVWDSRTGRATLTLPVTQNAQNQDTTSNDYRYIALSNRGNTVQIWDTTTGREVLDYRGHAANVRVLATGWAPDNRHVASLGSDGWLLIWDALTGKTLYSYQVSLLPTPGLLWSPDGRMITLVGQPIPFFGSAPPLIEVLQVGPN